MNKQMIISVMAKDRPGVIADITGAIFELDGDLADLNQSVLHGYLTMILIATFGSTVTPEDVVAKISHIKTEIPFEVMIRQLDNALELSQSTLPEETYIVTAQGENKSGLVYGISQFCHERDINIIDLATTLAEGKYTMVLQLDLQHVESLGILRKELEQFSNESGLKVTIQHNDIFKATHEVTLH